MTGDKDIVLVYYEDNPYMFARIEAISPDVKKDWWRVKLLILQVPPKVVTWILKEEYINGVEFTMSGNRMRMERVECPEELPPPSSEEDDEKPKEEKEGKVISLANRKRAPSEPT